MPSQNFGTFYYYPEHLQYPITDSFFSVPFAPPITIKSVTLIVQSLLHGAGCQSLLVFVYREMFVFSGFIFCLLIMIQSVSASLYCDNIHFPFRPAVTQSHCPPLNRHASISHISHFLNFISNVFCRH